jgi:hypothetical protein
LALEALVQVIQQVLTDNQPAVLTLYLVLSHLPVVVTAVQQTGVLLLLAVQVAVVKAVATVEVQQVEHLEPVDKDLLVVLVIVRRALVAEVALTRQEQMLLVVLEAKVAMEKHHLSLEHL